MFRIELDDFPPSNNAFLGKNKRWQYSREKKDWAARIYAAAVGQVPEKPYDKVVVKIHYVFPDHRRRDVDNYSGKFLLDPLVSMGIIRDDSFGCIDLDLSAEVQKGIRKTIITIN